MSHSCLYPGSYSLLVFNQMPLLTIFQFYWWMKLEYLDKATELPQVNDKHDHFMLYGLFLTMCGNKTHNRL